MDLTRGTNEPAVAPGVQAADLDDAAVARLLSAVDAESIALLEAWLKAHARDFAPIVMRAIEEPPGLSAEGARAVLDAMIWRSPSDGETTLRLMQACLGTIAQQLTTSLGVGAPGAISDRDDALVGSAVTVLTSSRPSRHSETAIDCLAESGPGGALILARAFDPVRKGLKVRIVRHLKPEDALTLGDNVVASLAHSVSRLADELEGAERTAATRFLAALGSVHHMEPSVIGAAEPLETGDRVFHASWGAGVVVAANPEHVTIDFGSAGTRTLMRALATLRRAV